MFNLNACINTLKTEALTGLLFLFNVYQIGYTINELEIHRQFVTMVLIKN